MKDEDCVRFLQWCLPRMKMRWRGFRRVRAQACKRIQRRMTELSCPDLGAYRRYLENNAEEWDVLDSLCRITVTRFHRDRLVFQVLMQEVLPDLARAALARDARTLRIWCAGCASGEEPYTLSIGWHLELAGHFPELGLEILATDIDSGLLARAALAHYPWSAVSNLPAAWRAAAFELRDGEYRLRPVFRLPVRFLDHDVRTPLPESGFDLILCRNLVFTYFDSDVQRRLAGDFRDHLLAGGVLLLGIHERLPEGGPRFQVVSERLSLYRRPPPDDTARP